ncbi:MAG: sugar ABC transporter permease [Chloroflexota bacterium]
MSQALETADPTKAVEHASGGTSPRAWRDRLARGEIGSLAVIAGIALVWAVFTVLNPNFLTARNLSNLVLQIAATGTISVGVVLVLLLGEIDLSIGAVSGLGAAVMAVLNVNHHWPAAAAILAGLLVGAVIGAFQGMWFSRLSIPSFVVTLAGLLAWQGVLLRVLGSQGTINLLDPGIDALAGEFLAPAVGWALALVCFVLYAVSLFQRRQRRAKAGLDLPAAGSLLWQLLLVGVLVAAAVAVLNAARGVPWALLILLALVVGFDFVARRTRFGRCIFAVGGNAEAARRAGISVSGIRVAVFTLAGSLAACGGILAASRLLAVNQSSGGSDLLLNSIAAAVIGGTSLFGGRGTVWSALTGALLIGSISNGMDLLALSSAIKFIVTGGVLLASVSIDAVARRGPRAA